MANFTEKAIKMALREILEEKPVNKITVKDIVDRCGINRNTFYYHYQDIPQLLEASITEDAEEIIREHPPVESMQDCMKAAVSLALANRKIVLNIFHSANREIYEAYQWRICEHLVTDYVDMVVKGHTIDPNDRQALIEILKCEIFGLAMGWLENNMQEDILVKVQNVVRIRERELERTIEQLEKKE